MEPDRRVAVLAGGVGAARFLHGLLRVVPPASVTVVGNVGDDTELHGLSISPDLDTVLYTLAGLIDDERGWGVRGDSARALERARALGAEAWFWLGDLDLGLHMARTERLARGETLSQATAALAAAVGLEVTLLPATDDRLRTMVAVEDGEIDFQTYYVRRQHRDDVRELRFDGADASRPAPGVVEAIEAADVVLLAPSNPFISIGPILAVPGIREALRRRERRAVAVSPIVGGDAVRGPAAAMLRSMGHDVSPVAVARLYADIVQALVVDRADAHLVDAIEREGVRAVVTEAVMHDHDARRDLAAVALDAAGGG